MRSCAQISKSQFSEYQNVLFFKRSTNVVSCTLGFEGAALKAAVEQLEEKRKKKKETFLLPADMDGKHDEVTERCGGGFMAVGCLMLGRRVYRAGTRHLLGLILPRFLPAV